MSSDGAVQALQGRDLPELLAGELLTAGVLGLAKGREVQLSACRGYLQYRDTYIIHGRNACYDSGIGYEIRESVATRIYITGSDVFLIEGESQMHSRCATEMVRGEEGGGGGAGEKKVGRGQTY